MEELLESHALPGARRGDFRPEVAHGAHHGRAGTQPRSSLLDHAGDSALGSNGGHHQRLGGRARARGARRHLRDVCATALRACWLINSCRARS